MSDVIEGNTSDEREYGVNHVRRIKPSSHANLEYDRLNLAAGKVQEAHGRRDLEEGRPAMVDKVRIVELKPLHNGADLVHQLDQFLL